MTRNDLMRAQSSEQGFVLIVVLLIVLVLTVIILEFSFSTRVNLHMADNCYRSQQALDCADAGVNVAIATLTTHEDIISDEAVAELLTGKTGVQLPAGYCTVRVEEENGRINVNQLRSGEGESARPRIDQMLRLIDVLNGKYGLEAPISYSIVPAIIDWIDSDDDITYLPFIERENKGAEEDYYEELPSPYLCKNAPLDTLDELLLVKGMTPQIFLGFPGDESAGLEPVPGMREFLTVYGDGRIDINHAPADVLESLSENITTEMASAIVEQRTLVPFESTQQLLGIPGITPDVFARIRGLVTVNPPLRYFRVTATGVAGDFKRSVRVVLSIGRSGQGATILLREEL
jgi:general secretion pathway protein K